MKKHLLFYIHLIIHSSLIFAINTLDLPGRRGKPQSNLFSLIVHDLCKRNMYINNIYDLFYF